MKIVRFLSPAKTTEFGIIEGDSIQVIEEPFSGIEKKRKKYSIHEVKLLAPTAPTKIVALGLNYKKHATELDKPLPNTPLLFLKPSTSVIGTEENIQYPPSSSRVDFEGELAVVIKKSAWLVPIEQVFDYVLGYTCFNDVTARDLQNRDMQWTRAKGFNTFAAMGPCIETELDPTNVDIETYLNGELKQKGNTNDLIFGVAELINFISHVMTLLPGDIIATGTPSGIGPMQPGDTVEIKIPAIGTLRNRVVSQPARLFEEE